MVAAVRDIRSSFPHMGGIDDDQDGGGETYDPTYQPGRKMMPRTIFHVGHRHTIDNFPPQTCKLKLANGDIDTK